MNKITVYSSTLAAIELLLDNPRIDSVDGIWADLTVFPNERAILEDAGVEIL